MSLAPTPSSRALEARSFGAPLYASPSTYAACSSLFAGLVVALALAPPAAGVAGALLPAGCAGVLFFVAFLPPAALFSRPWPALWSAVAGAGLLYALALLALLRLDLAAGQRAVHALDPAHTTGTAKLRQRSYGEHCELTPDNVSDALDIFVVAHVLGWVGKALIYRDFWFTMAASFVFELLEYTFEYLQPNFVECWWDHWVLDFILSNGLGILIGHGLMVAFGMKSYNWLGAPRAAPPASAGWLPQLRAQLALPGSPAKWEAAQSPLRAATLAVLFALGMLVDLNAFFLKFIFHAEVESPLNKARLCLWGLVAIASLRDAYASYCSATVHPRIGTSGWVALAMLAAETALVAKFGAQLPEWQGKAAPARVAAAWAAAALPTAALLAYWWGCGGGSRLRSAAAEDGGAAADSVSAASSAGSSGRSRSRKRA